MLTPVGRLAPGGAVGRFCFLRCLQVRWTLVLLLAAAFVGLADVLAECSPPSPGTITITATATDGSGALSGAEAVLTVMDRASSMTIGEAKARPDGTAVQLADLVATTGSSDFGGLFYAQECSGIAAIGVIWYGSVECGGVLSVTGTMATRGGERLVLAQSVDEQAHVSLSAERNCPIPGLSYTPIPFTRVPSQ